jgi:Uma2 family endonuclease
MAVAVQPHCPDIEVRKKLTPDDVYDMLMDGRLSWDDFFELDDGEIVELAPVHADHASCESNILDPLLTFARKAGGKVLPSSTGFMVGPDFRQLRSPDVSYVAPARVQDSYPRFIQGAPDLAVEVLSRGQFTAAYAKPKVREYFEAGAQIVWLVDIPRQEVRVYRKDSDEITVMRGKAILTLEPIVVGFKLRVADIFR